MSIVKTLAVAALVTIGGAWPALADCAADLTAIDQAMASASLTDDQKAQAEELKKSATDNCTAGKTDEAAAPIGQLKEMLGLS
ncbi:MAG: hypothetical protein R3D57_06460 [Hyphomicrobiaceae bacterium]